MNSEVAAKLGMVGARLVLGLVAKRKDKKIICKNRIKIDEDL